MNRIEPYRDLEVWQLGMCIAKDCYIATRNFPREEMFGMTSQIRKSSASVPANIAEGYGRDNRGDYIHLLRIAQGSLKELETHLLLSADVDLIKSETIAPILTLCDREGRMIRTLIRKLQESK